MMRAVFVAIYCTIIATLHVTGNVWRIESTEGDAAIFTTRNAVRLNYLDETGFVRWDLEDHICTVVNDSLPQTEFRCRIPGLIKVAVKTTSKYLVKHLRVTHSIECFHWHVYKNPISFNEFNNRLHIHEIDLLVWIGDMRYASEDEKLNRASSPSNYSRALTKQFHTLGQHPIITVVQEDLLGYDAEHAIITFDEYRGLWRSIVHVLGYRQPKVLISGLPISLFDCLIRNEYAVLPLNVPNKITGPDDQVDNEGKMLHLRANVTRPVLVKDACAETPAVLLTSDSVYMTWDGFLSSEPLHIPDNGTFESVPTAEFAAFTYRYLVLLINSTLHFMEKSTRSWHSVRVPTDDLVIGLKGRDVCHPGHFYMLMEEALVVWTRLTVFVSTNHSQASDGDFHQIEFDALTIFEVTIQEVSFHSLPHLVGILLISKETTFFLKYDIPLRKLMSIPGYEYGDDISGKLIFLKSGAASFLAWDNDSLSYGFDQAFLQVDLHHVPLLEPGETIQQVVVSPTDDMIVRTSHNRLRYGRPSDSTFTPLESGELPDTPMELWFDARGTLYAITLNGSTVVRRLIPLYHEIISTSFPETECQYLEFSTDVDQKLIHMDKMESFDFTCRLIKRNTQPQLTIKLLFDEADYVSTNTTAYKDFYDDNIMHSLVITFTQDWDLNPGMLSYVELVQESVRTLSFQLIPSMTHKVCKNASLVTHISVGCRAGWNIRVKPPKRYDKNGCKRFTEYKINGKYRQNYWDDGKMPDITVPYDFDTLGCPISLRNIDIFVPDILLYDFDKFVKPVEANLILWEQHARKDYEYNSTMYKVLCWRKAQTWASMTQKFNAGTPMEEIWDPENYKSCFDKSYGLSTKAKLSRPYEIINRTGGVGITFPVDYHAIFVFNVKVVDPDFSFCPLMTQFAVVVPQWKFSIMFLVLTLLGITMLLFVFLVGSYVYFTNNVYLRTE